MFEVWIEERDGMSVFISEHATWQEARIAGQQYLKQHPDVEVGIDLHLELETLS